MLVSSKEQGPKSRTLFFLPLVTKAVLGELLCAFSGKRGCWICIPDRIQLPKDLNLGFPCGHWFKSLRWDQCFSVGGHLFFQTIRKTLVFAQLLLTVVRGRTIWEVGLLGWLPSLQQPQWDEAVEISASGIFFCSPWFVFMNGHVGVHVHPVTFKGYQKAGEQVNSLESKHSGWGWEFSKWWVPIFLKWSKDKSHRQLGAI